MFQWAISLFITISPCPVSRGPDPNIVSGTWDSSHQSPVGHAHCTLGSVEFLSFDIVSLSPSSQYSEKETTCFMAQLAEILKFEGASSCWRNIVYSSEYRCKK